MKAAIRNGILGFVFLLLLFQLGLAAPRTFVVQETDFVKIRLEVIDADSDQVLYSYSPPLDEKGEWQTSLNDAGIYNITVTASDGVHQTAEQITLVVENKNQAPRLLENKLTVKETQTVDLKSLVEDADGDVLAFEFQPPFDSEGRWKTRLNDAGKEVVLFRASDGYSTEIMRVELEIINTNQAPSITETFSAVSRVAAPEDQTLRFWANGADSDDDELAYLWELDESKVSETSSGEYHFDFDAAGEHYLKLTVRDQELAAEQEWVIAVENVNRKPEFSVLPITAEEGDLVTLEVPATDVDGDALTYSFQAPLSPEGSWQTGYEDAGKYFLNITTTDGKLSVAKSAEITILNVDRAPVLEVPERLDAWEGQEVSLAITTYDPDGDAITLTFDHLPAGARFESNSSSIIWTPPYDALQRRGGGISNILNAIRVENAFLRRGKMPFTATACSNQLCSSSTATIIIHNVNRPPEFINISKVIVTETEKVQLKLQALDPDGDIVHYYFTAPLGKRTGRWQTGYDDAAVYEVYVTATDGTAGTTIPVKLKVLDKNRQPSLQVKPQEIVVNEGEEFSLQASAADPDGDELTIVLKSIPEAARFTEGIFTWKPGFEIVDEFSPTFRNKVASSSFFLNRHFNTEDQVLWLEFVASDDEFNTTFPVKVTIKNVNQPPEIIDYLPSVKSSAKVHEPVLFHAAVKDPDKNNVTFSWDFNGVKVSGTNTVRHTFVMPGVKKVTFTASDGREEVQRKWLIAVEDAPYVPPAEPAAPPTFKVYVITS